MCLIQFNLKKLFFKKIRFYKEVRKEKRIEIERKKQRLLRPFDYLDLEVKYMELSYEHVEMLETPCRKCIKDTFTSKYHRSIPFIDLQSMSHFDILFDI